jgi:hypothetical protein
MVNFGLSFSELIMTITLLLVILGGWVTLQIRISNISLNLKKLEQRQEEDRSRVQRHKDAADQQFFSITAVNKGDHDAILKKIDENHNIVMEVLLRR